MIALIDVECEYSDVCAQGVKCRGPCRMATFWPQHLFAEQLLRVWVAFYSLSWPDKSFCCLVIHGTLAQFEERKGNPSLILKEPSLLPYSRDLPSCSIAYALRIPSVVPSPLLFHLFFIVLFHGKVAIPNFTCSRSILCLIWHDMRKHLRTTTSLERHLPA